MYVPRPFSFGICEMICTWTINEPHLPYKTGLDVMQSHPLRRMRFGQYQASSAALGWPGDGDCYLMHRMQSGGWPYSKVGRDSSKAPSLRAAVFRSKILRSNWSRVIDTCVHARAYRGTGGTGSIVNKAQGKQCVFKGCVCINVPSQVNCMFRLR